jgi:hypothetical protein
MKALELIRTRIILFESAFAELALWEVPTPVTGSKYRCKYRLAYVVGGVCVLRYDNEAGKGDHRHLGAQEGPYFQRDIARWDDENSDS